MEIKEPRYKVCDKVKFTNQPGIFEIVEMINFNFCVNDYFYVIKHMDFGELLVTNEANLELYVEKPKSVWDLKKGDCYVIANIDGRLSEIHWDGMAIEKSCRNLGNCFLTKEEAEFECERRKIEAKMIKLGGRRKRNKDEDNYYIAYENKTGNLAYHICIWENIQGAIYFDSEEKAEEAVKIIGKDIIKKYIFGVNE